MGISQSYFNTFQSYCSTSNNLTSASGNKNVVFNSSFSTNANVIYSAVTNGIWKGIVFYTSSAAYGGTIFWKGTSSFNVSGKI